MAIGRVVEPEWLDNLPPDDPAARRSRWDLRLINGLMGNFRWAKRVIAAHEGHVASGIVEIGAGEGAFCRNLRRSRPSALITGIDLLPSPPDLKVRWLSGDLFEILPQLHGGILVGTMILHHFADEKLRALRPAMDGFRVLCFNEPWRAWPPLCLSGGMFPFVGKVTRHDMPASIRAGFRPGELAALLALEKWRVRESIDWRGAIRVEAWRP